MVVAAGASGRSAQWWQMAPWQTVVDGSASAGPVTTGSAANGPSTDRSAGIGPATACSGRRMAPASLSAQAAASAAHGGGERHLGCGGKRLGGQWWMDPPLPAPWQPDPREPTLQWPDPRAPVLRRPDPRRLDSRVLFVFIFYFIFLIFILLANDISIRTRKLDFHMRVHIPYL